MELKIVSKGLYFIAMLAMIALMLAACQSNASEVPAETAVEVENTDSHVTGRTLSSGLGAPLSDYFEAPASIQDLINRYDVAFVGTVATIGSSVEEKPDDWNSEVDDHLATKGIPPLRVRITYYDITLEEVLLDDGLVNGNPRLRLSGDHNPMRPQAGERYFFALQTVSGAKGYGVNANWNLIHLDGGSIRNFDGVEPGYPGVTDEASLKSEAKSAVTNRSHLPMDDWPAREKWQD